MTLIVNLEGHKANINLESSFLANKVGEVIDKSCFSKCLEFLHP